mgnify:CR=1 FL=1
MLGQQQQHGSQFAVFRWEVPDIPKKGTKGLTWKGHSNRVSNAIIYRSPEGADPGALSGKVQKVRIRVTSQALRCRAETHAA